MFCSGMTTWCSLMPRVCRWDLTRRLEPQSGPNTCSLLDHISTSCSIQTAVTLNGVINSRWDNCVSPLYRLGRHVVVVLSVCMDVTSFFTNLFLNCWLDSYATFCRWGVPSQTRVTVLYFTKTVGDTHFFLITTSYFDLEGDRSLF